MSDKGRLIRKSGLSDDAVDAIVAILMITITVSGVVYWLASMPS